MATQTEMNMKKKKNEKKRWLSSMVRALLKACPSHIPDFYERENRLDSCYEDLKDILPPNSNDMVRSFIPERLWFFLKLGLFACTEQGATQHWNLNMPPCLFLLTQWLTMFRLKPKEQDPNLETVAEDGLRCWIVLTPYKRLLSVTTAKWDRHFWLFVGRLKPSCLGYKIGRKRLWRLWDKKELDLGGQLVFNSH